jgi:apolipoprotein N-acyltransferase
MVFLRSFAMRVVCAVLAGAVFAMAYPPLGWRWLVVPGMAGLILVLRGQVGTRARVLGMAHGFTAYAVGLPWLLELFGILALVLWCVLGVFHALFAEMLSRAERRGWNGWRLAIFITLNWGAWEFIRAELFPLKFPWMTVGLAMGPNAMLPWVGVYAAGTCLVLACVRAWRPVVALGFGILVLIFSFRALPEPAAGDSRVVKVGGVQLEGVTLDDYIKHTRLLPEDVEYVVWPEYAVAYDIRKNERDWKLVSNLCAERDITLTFGTQQAESEAWRNIALTMDGSGVRGIHNKVNTVHFFDDGIPGTKAGVVETRHGRVGTPICFDCDYEGVARRMTASGAEVLMVPVMDAVSWTRRQHDQHAELMRMRAAENGRWVFVVGTSGVSMAIDPHGHVHARLAAMEQGTLLASVRTETGKTFYTYYGWLMPWCILAVAGVFWVILILPIRKST